MESSKFREVCNDIESQAQRFGITVHPSFTTEIANYLLHDKVSDLSDSDQEQVARVIAGIGLRLAARDRLGTAGGSVIRETMVKLCPHAFRTCNAIAEGVLLGEITTNFELDG